MKSKKVLVLGGGQQGSVVAAELAKNHEVIVGDLKRTNIPDTASVLVNVKDRITYEQLVNHVDLVVGCTPSSAGTGPIEETIFQGKDFVDLSYTNDDLSFFDGIAKRKGSTVLHDCGFAPGLPNLLIGRELKANNDSLEYVGAAVGGIAADPQAPYGYVNTWSLEDLKEEYSRPAKVVKDGKVRTKHPYYSEPESIVINGRLLEAFYSDGLRSLLRLKDKIPHMVEKTLRWPGHMLNVHRLMDEGTLVQEFSDKCAEGNDLIIMQVNFPDKCYYMELEGTPEISALAKVTAYSCAAFAETVLQGYYSSLGVHPPEDLGGSFLAYDFILDYLGERGVNIESD